MYEILIDPNVYNGKKKINSQNHNFMSATDVVKSLSIKNCIEHDHIPQRALIDGIEILKTQLSIIFSKIYQTKQIPQ